MLILEPSLQNPVISGQSRKELEVSDILFTVTWFCFTKFTQGIFT